MKFWSLDEIPPETILILVKFWSSVSGLASRLLVSGFPISCWWHLTNDYFSERLKLASSCSLLQEGAHGWVRYDLGYGLADGYIYIHTHVCARLELLRQVISTIIWDASPQGFPCPQCPQSLSRPVPCRPSAFRASRTLVARHRWKASSPVGSSMWSISSSNLADG